MSQPSSPPAAEPAAPPRQALHIVLFGMPDAGKSSLLGALGQAAQSQEHVLNAKLSDPSGGLAELQKRLYEERPRETLEEVVPYTVTITPFTKEAADKPEPETAVLVDCNGRVANDLLSGNMVLNAKGDGALAESILQADTLVLLVDASAGDAVLDRDFAQFATFLRLLEQSRGMRSDVGGLPVYLVLTKCDLLARKTDNASDWMERIEERKRQVYEQFQNFLKRDAEGEPLPFGRVELHLWATAVKRPALADAPARPREPYGVAELFRQCFEAAKTFQQRQRESGRQLGWLTISVLAAVGCMVLLIVFLAFNRAGADPLANDVRNFQATEGGGGDRLREPLEAREKRLKEFKDQPGFARLPGDLQHFVDEYLQEVQAYRQYLAQVEGFGDPRFARDDKTLKSKEEGLARLSPPAAYRESWAASRAERLRRGWLKDAQAMERAADAAEQFYRGLVKRRRDLVGASLTEDQRRDKFHELLKDADRPPYRLEDRKLPLPGASTAPGVPHPTYEDVMQFDRVNDAYQEWLRVREELEAKMRMPRT